MTTGEAVPREVESRGGSIGGFLRRESGMVARASSGGREAGDREDGDGGAPAGDGGELSHFFWLEREPLCGVDCGHHSVDACFAFRGIPIYQGGVANSRHRSASQKSIEISIVPAGDFPSSSSTPARRRAISRERVQWRWNTWQQLAFRHDFLTPVSNFVALNMVSVRKRPMSLDAPLAFLSAPSQSFVSVAHTRIAASVIGEVGEMEARLRRYKTARFKGV